MENCSIRLSFAADRKQTEEETLPSSSAGAKTFLLKTCFKKLFLLLFVWQAVKRNFPEIRYLGRSDLGDVVVYGDKLRRTEGVCTSI
jgi:hypothetical protein